MLLGGGVGTARLPASHTTPTTCCLSPLPEVLARLLERQHAECRQMSATHAQMTAGVPFACDHHPPQLSLFVCCSAYHPC